MQVGVRCAMDVLAHLWMCADAGHGGCVCNAVRGVVCVCVWCVVRGVGGRPRQKHIFLNPCESKSG